MDYRDNRQRWAESHQVVHFYAGQWCTFTPALTVEQSHLGVGSTLDKLGIPKTTFYRWYDRFLAFGDAGLEDRNSSPGRVWNRIPDDVRGQIIDLALEETQLSPRELAVRFTDTRGYFVSEASVYRLLKAHGLMAMSLSLLKFVGQASLVDDAMLPS